MWSEGLSTRSRDPEPAIPYQQPEPEQRLSCPGHGVHLHMSLPCAEVVQPLLCGQQGCAEGSRTCPILLELIIKIAAADKKLHPQAPSALVLPGLGGLDAIPAQRGQHIPGEHFQDSPCQGTAPSPSPIPSIQPWVWHISRHPSAAEGNWGLGTSTPLEVQLLHTSECLQSPWGCG